MNSLTNILKFYVLIHLFPNINTHIINPDAGIYIAELVTKYGYPFERYSVTTEDGYILELHRIPGGRNLEFSAGLPVVLIMHGLGCNSENWVDMGPDRSLAYLFADAGFDVWLGNVRGNLWSRKHVSLDPETQSAIYTNFSWHEIGIYDLPAKIDFILEKTQQKNLFYVGHSQGTTAFFVMASMKPEYNSKIRLMHALAPVVFSNHAHNPIIRVLSLVQNNFKKFLDAAQIYDLPYSKNLSFSLMTACARASILQKLCPWLLFLVGGINFKEVDYNELSVIFTSVPAGLVTKQVFHYLQLVRSGEFRQYENGDDFTTKPPAYDLSKVTAPVIIHYANNDWLAATKDVERLISLLPNVQDVNLMEEKRFCHTDFMWAEKVRELLNDRIIEQTKSWLNN